jgi:hypothetical protein
MVCPSIIMGVKFSSSDSVRNHPDLRGDWLDSVSTSKPGELAGYGTGAPTDYGTTGYRPPAALRDLVVTRTPVCGFSSCLSSIHRGDLDHREPHAPPPRQAHSRLISGPRRARHPDLDQPQRSYLDPSTRTDRRTRISSPAHRAGGTVAVLRQREVPGRTSLATTSLR